jgi:tetratricopeptide (TPR) repeat protein
MQKYIFYIKLLTYLVGRLSFSVDSVKAFCTRGIKKDPGNYHTRFLLAELERSEGNNKLAIEGYKALLNYGFRNLNVLHGLAMASFKEQMYDESQKYFEMILESEPNDKAALDHLGRINLVKKEYREAIRCFEQSLRIDPRNPLVLENMAYCYYNIEDYHKSYEAYRAALELDPNSEHLEKYMNLAKSELEKYGASRKGTLPHD